MTQPDLPKGFSCTKCGTEHQFTPYVYAHWDILIGHTCDCGAEHGILRGQATRENPEPVEPAQALGAVLVMGALRL